MAEKRKKSGRILLGFPGKKEAANAENIELFPAEQWRGGHAGYFRLRIGGKFRDNPDGSNAYVTPEEIGKLVAAAVGAAFGVPVRERIPRIPANTSVRVVTSVLAGVKFYTRTRTCAPPHRGPDGRYMVWVFIPEEGYREVHWSEVEIDRWRPLTVTQREHFRREEEKERQPCNG